MNDDISNLFSYPFEKDQLPFPTSTETGLFWNIQYSDSLNNFPQFDSIQNFKPYADVWQAYNFEMQTDFMEGTLYQNIFCALPKQKEAALYMMAQSIHHLREGGLLLCIAANDAGGKNIEKWMKTMGLSPTSASKSKCRIVWAFKADINDDVVQKHKAQGSPCQLDIKGCNYTTQAGIYGWNKIDKGSEILMQNLPDLLNDHGADFGAGYGYLSHQILQRKHGLKSLDVLEADKNALQCAQQNLAPYEADLKITYHWADLTKPQTALKNLDFIIMNPPFHEGKQTKHSVGQDFISTAASCLRNKGCLYMVANSHLPYEKILESHFTTVDKIYEDNGYKVFQAQK